MTAPLYQALADEFTARIRDGLWLQGEPIPSEQRLCADFSVSRGPVRQALAQLRREGLIVGGQGRAPRVARDPHPQPVNVFVSFSAWATEGGHTPGQRTIEIARRAAGPLSASQLRIEPSDPVVTLLRMRSLDGEPVMLERTAWVDHVGRHLLATDTDAGSTYAFLTSKGVDLFAATHVLDAVAADATDAEHLPVDVGAPLLRERRTTVDPTGIVLEYADDRYLPQRANFIVHNRRTSQGHLGLIDPSRARSSQ